MGRGQLAVDETTRVGIVYKFEGDAAAIARPDGLLRSHADPAAALLGEEIFWLGWNDEEIHLPARARLSELTQPGIMPGDLTYLKVFSATAELTWQQDSNSNPIARLCLEVEDEKDAPTRQGAWVRDGVFGCRHSTRVLVGESVRRHHGDNENGMQVLLELRYPRPFVYPGVNCGNQGRVQAAVYEYLERSSHRPMLVRYRSLNAV